MLEDDTSYRRELKRDCENRAQEFEVTTKDNNADLTALGEAKATMLKKLPAFVQTGAKTTMSARDDAADDAKARVLKSIDQFVRRLHKTALIALAYRAASDPVRNTRGMIRR